MNGAAAARTIGVLAIFGVAATAVGVVQPRLSAAVHRVKQRDDVYVFPPPAELRLLTLGYDAAAVDLFWGKLLVEYGTHWQERRPFPTAPRYLDAIIALEPDYAPVYRYADTILVFHPPRGDRDDVLLARKFLERGIKERPYDYRLWLQYGQFVAFTAPSFFSDEKETETWRKEGALAIGHAVELGAYVDRTLSASSVLGSAGERGAAIQQLRRAWAMTDDPTMKNEFAARLRRLDAQASFDEAQRDLDFVLQAFPEHAYLGQGSDHPSSVTGYLATGPFVDPAACAGVEQAFSPRCAHDWRTMVRFVHDE